MAAPAISITRSHSARLADPALHEALAQLARRRLPPGEVDDLVQNTLTDALDAQGAPSEDAAFRRWVQGIARHKIADLYRRRGRLPPHEPERDDTGTADSGPATGELEQWIEHELPKTEGARATLHWLLRESEGETLDEIAREEALPAPRVRQRVSRLRRHFQTRWLALGAAGLALLLGAGYLVHTWQVAAGSTPPIAREPITPEERARALREQGLERCAANDYAECVRALDEAKAIDPVGDQASAITEARAAAARARTNAPAPSPDPSAHTLGPAPKQKAPANKAYSKLKPKLDIAPEKPVAPSFQEQKSMPNPEPLYNQMPTKSNSLPVQKK